jgi:riboflavin biosynthesis pyrimidine reductase
MATYGMTQPASHRHVSRNAVITLLLAAALAVGVGIGRATEPAPETQVRYTPAPELTSPWRTHYIDALNRMERQQVRVETPQGQL